MRQGKILAYFCLFVVVFALTLTVSAQRTKKTIALAPPEPEASAYDLDQCRNGSVEDATNPDCIDTGSGNAGWVNGNAGSSNAHWAESQFIAYRARLQGLTNGSHTIILQYDLKHSSKMAIDYLGSYNVTETDAIPCSGVSGCAGAPNTFTIPVDPAVVASINPNTGLPIVVPGPAQRQMSIWGGTITSISYVENPYVIDPSAAVQARTISVTFTSTVANPVLAWGGHIGWRGDWGAGNSAGGISGSPYHMRILELDGSGGNQDRSLSADAVDASGGVIIVKKVETPDNADWSNQAFDFTASSFFPNPVDPQNQFQLTDNTPGSGGAARGSAAIFDNGQTTLITVTEGETLGWTFVSVDCDDADSTQDSQFPVANIQVTGGEIVTCTFVNGLETPSAAPASVSGRVTDSMGRGISSARMSLFNASTGEAYQVYTNTFGYYKFNDLPVGDFYVMSVDHRRYVFVTGSVSFSLDDNLTGLDFQSSR